MKKVLPEVFLLTTFFFFLLPLAAISQCSCSDGTPANRVEHLVVLNSTNQSNTIISFPKFDPAVGTLSCVTLNDTISIVSSTGIRNYDAAPVEYEFQLTVNTEVEGPSLKRTNFKNVLYGPDLLQAYGTPGDSINYGPDTIYNNFASQKTNTTDMTPYMGSTGTVDFEYTIGGGVIASGGANYNAQVRTTTWGTFKLTYMWCENMVLASSIRNFSVAPAGDMVELSWTGPGNSKNENFIIQTSNDGQSFSDLKQGSGNYTVESASAKYKFKYRPHQSTHQKIFYRIKYYSGDQVKYSETIWLYVKPTEAGNIAAYPNPVKQAVRLQFTEPLNGEINVELTNQAGQTVYSQRLFASGAKGLQLNLSNPPPPGMYFMKVRPEGAGKVYTGKLLFTR